MPAPGGSTTNSQQALPCVVHGRRVPPYMLACCPSGLAHQQRRGVPWVFTPATHDTTPRVPGRCVALREGSAARRAHARAWCPLVHLHCGAPREANSAASDATHALASPGTTTTAAVDGERPRQEPVRATQRSRGICPPASAHAGSQWRRVRPGKVYPQNQSAVYAYTFRYPGIDLNISNKIK